jgi:hypothetical protein
MATKRAPGSEDNFTGLPKRKEEIPITFTSSPSRQMQVSPCNQLQASLFSSQDEGCQGTWDSQAVEASEW